VIVAIDRAAMVAGRNFIRASYASPPQRQR
jgi:hypothetical protein